MALTDLIPVVGPVLNAASSLISSSSAQNAYANRYQTEVADLKKAGLNPALAYGQNPGEPPAMTIGDNVGGDVASALQARQAIKQQQAATDLTQAQADLLKAQKTDLITSTHAKAMVDQQLPDQQRFQNIVSEMNSLVAQRSNARDLATYNSSVEGQNARNRAEVLRSQLLGLDLPEAKALSKWWKNHPDLGAWANSAGGLSAILHGAGRLATALPE